MAYIFYLKDLRGFGDCLFALKACSGIEKQLLKKGYDCDIYLVISSGQGKQKILSLGGDEEFKVTILTMDEYEQLTQQKDFKIDYYIEGPIPDSKRPELPKETPILLISEYSSPHSVADHQSELLTQGYKNVSVIFSGLKVNSKERGIFISDNLAEVADKKELNIFNFRKEYWDELEVLPIRNGQSIESYHQTTELYFECSHNAYGVEKNFCEHFLFVHDLFTETSEKNQDIISLGSDIETKKASLLSVLPNLKQKYNQIVLLDLETKETKELHNDGEENPRIYRMLYVKQLSHKQMDALHAVSNDLAGERGDQLHGEGVSSRKIMVYECLPHKQDYANSFINLLYSITQNQRVKELAQLLLSGNLNEKSATYQGDRERLRALLKDPDVIKAYQYGCKIISIKYNLHNKIMDILTANLIKHNEEHQTKFEAIVNKFKSVRSAYPSHGIRRTLKLFTPHVRFDSVDATENLIQALIMQIASGKANYILGYKTLVDHIDSEIEKMKLERSGRNLVEESPQRLVALYNKLLVQEDDERSEFLRNKMN